MSYGDVQVLAYYLDIRFVSESVRLPGYGINAFHEICVRHISGQELRRNVRIQFARFRAKTGIYIYIFILYCISI